MQTGSYHKRKLIEALNFGFRKKRNCTINEAKRKVLISCVVTAHLICAFVSQMQIAGFLDLVPVSVMFNKLSFQWF